MDERGPSPPILSTWTINRPDSRPERMVAMTFGKDFFKILNLVVQIMRLFAKVFGDEQDQLAAKESEKRTLDGDPNHSC